MKTFLTLLFVTSLSAFAQDGVTVRSRNGSATNLTVKGTTTAQKLVATNVFSGALRVTNTAAIGGNVGVGTTNISKILTINMDGDVAHAAEHSVHITGANAATGNKFLFDLDTVSYLDGDLYGVFSHPRHTPGNLGSIIAVEGWLSSSPHTSSDGGYHASIIGHTQSESGGHTNTVNYGGMFIARRAEKNASVYAPIGDVVLNDWVGIGLYDRESDAGLVTDLRGQAILPTYPFHFKDRSSLTNVEDPGRASVFLEKVRLGNTTNAESAALLYLRRSVSNVVSEAGNFITANTKNRDVFSVGPNGNVYASVLSTNNTGPTEVARFEARDISNDQVRGVLVYGTTLSGLPVVGLGKSTTAPFGLFAFGGVNQLFNLADDGLASFTPSVSSAAAFGVFPAGSSTPAFNVDTSNRRVGVGLAFAPDYTLSVAFTDATTYSVGGVAQQGVSIYNGSTVTGSAATLYFLNGNSGAGYGAISSVREGSVANRLTFRVTNPGEGIVEGMQITSLGNVSTPGTNIATKGFSSDGTWGTRMPTNPPVDGYVLTAAGTLGHTKFAAAPGLGSTLPLTVPTLIGTNGSNAGGLTRGWFYNTNALGAGYTGLEWHTANGTTIDVIYQDINGLRMKAGGTDFVFDDGLTIVDLGGTGTRIVTVDADGNLAATGSVPIIPNESLPDPMTIGTLNVSAVKYATNGVPDVTLIDLAKSYAHTNHTAAFTISGFTPGSYDTSGTNYQFATRCFTNNSVGAKSITLPASWIDLGLKGNPVYNTNIGTLSIWSIPGFATNYLWVGR